MTSDQLALIVCWTSLVGVLVSVVRMSSAPVSAARRTPAWLLTLAAAMAMRTLLPAGAIDPHGHGLERAAPFLHYGPFGPLLGEVVHGAAMMAWSRATVLPTAGWLDLGASSALLLALAVGVSAWVDEGDGGDEPRAPVLTFLALALFAPLLRLAPTATLVLGSAAGWIATDALARQFTRHGGRLAWVGLLSAAVWTMQTHLELMAWVPALLAVRLGADGRASLRALGPAQVLGGIALAGCALAPHLAHMAEVHTPGSHVSMLATLTDTARRPVIGMFGVLTGVALVIAALLPKASRAPTPARIPTTLASIAAVVAAVAGLSHDAWGPAGADQVWPETTVLMHHGFFPWPAATIVAIGWLDDAIRRRGPGRVWLDTALLLGLLAVYARSADCFSTWLREGALPAAMLLPWATRGLTVLPVPLRALAVIASVYLARGALWTPLDTQQETGLARAAAAIRSAGGRVHGLTSTDDEGFGDPTRLDLARRRRPHDLVVDPTLDALAENSLTALLQAGDHAVGRHVLLDVACARTTASNRVIDAEALVMDGARAIAQGPKRRDEAERGRIVRPDAALEILDDAPCLGQPDAQRCTETEPDGTCRTYACAPGTQPKPDGWTNALCNAVRARFVLSPVVEEPLAPWTVDAAWAAPVARNLSVGLYRITGLTDADATETVRALEPSDATR